MKMGRARANYLLADPAKQGRLVSGATSSSRSLAWVSSSTRDWCGARLFGRAPSPQSRVWFLGALPGSAMEARMFTVKYPRCAGLDLHKRQITACRLAPGPTGELQAELRTFGTMTCD